MDGKMTIKDVLEITIRNLKSIMLPVELGETAGQAIMGSIRNLEACIKAMDNAAEDTTDDRETDAE